MCFKRYRPKQKMTKIKKNKIKPYVYIEDVSKITTEQFLKEKIICKNCKQMFDLGSNEIKIHCAGCNEFFHCGIAGKCNCSDCKTIMIDNQIHNLSWCINCVPKTEYNKEKKYGVGFCNCK